MREYRSSSQILFGHLPEQTVDVRGGVWKIRSWRTTPVHDVDSETMRGELTRLAAPWEATGRDGGYGRLLRAGRNIQVKSLDPQAGVWLEAFPKTWRCKSCYRLLDGPRRKCTCGSKGPHGQLPFVLVCPACGDIREPYYPRCPKHGEAKMNLPGTTSLQEIKLSCPVQGCQIKLRSNFLYTKCGCGEKGKDGQSGNFMEFTVHRSSSVYVPRSLVIVNPPSRQQFRRLEAAGGGPAALNWVVGGMTERWVDEMEGGQVAALRRFLAEQGRTNEEIEAAISALGDTGGAGERHVLDVSPVVREMAEREARDIALAMSETRQTFESMRDKAYGERVELYRKRYPDALRRARFQRVDLIERFPVLTGQFGYTRGAHEPGASRLRGFVERDGTVVVYGDLATTEALFVRLDPLATLQWLGARGHEVQDAAGAPEAYEKILKAVGPDPDSSKITEDLTVLVHSVSHRMVRQASFFAGIERDSLSELLFPTALAFVTYAVPRGDFVLGGLQAMMEYDLDKVLDRLVHDESRCALDPGCWNAKDGAACAVCLHLGEPSCRMFNTKLDRRALFDEDGYFRIPFA